MKPINVVSFNISKKPLTLVAVLVTFLGLTGCASKIANVTDSLTLYPDNKSAEKWGVIEHIDQYRGNAQQNRPVYIKLPNDEVVKGQITYIEQTSTEVSNGWDNVYMGFNSGFGGRHHRGGSFGYGFGFSPTPRVTTVRSNILPFSLDGFGEKTRMNCEGVFTRSQNLGTINCDLSNGMKYKGHMRRVVVYQTVN